MNNELMIFKNENFGQIRTLIIDDQPWFVGKDVADVLGYAKPQNAIISHVDEDDTLKQGIIDNLGRTQKTNLINESGLYSLVLSSRLPSAKKFKRWVTSEILPAIRKSGYYLGSQESVLRELKSDGLLDEYMKLSEVDRLIKYFTLVKENETLKDEINKHANYMDYFIEQVKFCSNSIKKEVSKDSTALIKGDNR